MTASLARCGVRVGTDGPSEGLDAMGWAVEPDRLPVRIAFDECGARAPANSAGPAEPAGEGHLFAERHEDRIGAGGEQSVLSSDSGAMVMKQDPQLGERGRRDRQRSCRRCRPSDGRRPWPIWTVQRPRTEEEV